MASSEYDALLEPSPTKPSEYDALLTEPQQAAPTHQGGVLSGIGAGIWRAIPKSLGEVAGMVGADIVPNAVHEVLQAGREVRDVAGGATPTEAVKREDPEALQQGAVLRGEYGTREQAAAITGLGIQAATLALPFFKPLRLKLRDIAFGKPAPETLSEAAANETQQLGGEANATEKRQVQESVQPERARDDSGRTPTETGVSGGVREAAEGEAQAVSPLSQQAFPSILRSAEDVRRGALTEREQLEQPTPTADRWFRAKTAEGQALGEQVDILRKAGQPIPKPLADAVDRVNQELREGYNPPEEPKPKTEGGGVVEAKDEKVQEGTQGRVLEPAAAEQSPASAAERKTPAPTESPSTPVRGAVGTGGVHAEALSERPIEAPEGGDVVGWQESTDLGHKWLDKGGDPNKIISHFQKTGAISTLNMGRMRAAMLRREAATDLAKDALDANPNDLELKSSYDKAVADEQAFANDYKPMHTTASNTLRSLQGREPLTAEMAQSPSGLTRQFTEIQKKVPDAKQSSRIRELSDRSKKANGEYAQANQEMFNRLNTEYGRIKGGKVETLNDLKSLFSEALKEVCDV